MMQQLQVGNRFHSLQADDPDNSDNETEQTISQKTEKLHGEASSTGVTRNTMTSTMMLSVFKPELTHQPREPWDIAVPIDFNDLDSIANLIHHIDGVFGSMKEVSRPLGMEVWMTQAKHGGGQMLLLAKCPEHHRRTPHGLSARGKCSNH